jgi:hypothetical protein
VGLVANDKRVMTWREQERDAAGAEAFCSSRRSQLAGVLLSV